MTGTDGTPEPSAPVVALPFSAPAERNRQPILDVLAGVLAGDARVLEIASGTGQHAAHAAAARPGWHWQPSDLEPATLAAIDARCGGLVNVAPAARLDVLEADWPVEPGSVDAVFCANLLHIAPWTCCAGLMRGAARVLRPQGVLLLYGPYQVDRVPTSPGNLAFDADLRRRDARWGIRRLVDVEAEAALLGFALRTRVPMPANNLTLIFSR